MRLVVVSKAAGDVRFDDAVVRACFCLERAALCAAPLAVLNGLTPGLQMLVRADADARQILRESVSGAR